MKSSHTTFTRGGRALTYLRSPRGLLGPILARAEEPKPAPCIVYDAAGRPVATIDPITRKRTPLAR